MGCKLSELEWPDHWWWRKGGRLAPPGGSADPALEWVDAAFAGVGDEESPTPDVSAEEWLRCKVRRCCCCCCTWELACSTWYLAWL